MTQYEPTGRQMIWHSTHERMTWTLVLMTCSTNVYKFHYLRTWFTFDVFLVMSDWMGLVLVMIAGTSPDHDGQWQEDESLEPYIAIRSLCGFLLVGDFLASMSFLHFYLLCGSNHAKLLPVVVEQTHIQQDIGRYCAPWTLTFRCYALLPFQLVAVAGFTS
eukprot:5351465-Amphidinium_carterae.1